MTTIKVFEITGRNAISMQKGDLIYKTLEQNFKNKEKVILDFDGVSLFASPFFNTSVGHLLKDISVEELLQFMEPIHLNETGKELLNLVIGNAITFYSNQKRDAHIES